MTITVYVGDNDESLSIEAKKHNMDAYLVHKKNYKEFLKTDFAHDITVFTSLTDLPKINDNECALYNVLKKASNVVYAPSTKWVDDHSDFSVSSERHLTEYIIMIVGYEGTTIGGMNLKKYNKRYIGLEDVRSEESLTLWVTGCSISHGVGVSNHEKFSMLVSDKLQIPLVSLTMGGSSIEWSNDQLIRSDIRRGDIVIWGLTSESRTPKWSMAEMRCIPNTSKKSKISNTRLYKAVISVHQVMNYCNKIGAKLIIMPLICSEELRMHFNNIDVFHQLPYSISMLDIGTDGIHPGRMQHREWADACINIIEDRNYLIK